MGIMLSEISQAERDKYFMVSLICEIQKAKKENCDLPYTENRLEGLPEMGLPLLEMGGGR